MKKLILAFAATAFATASVPALAGDDASPIIVKRDGITYRYSDTTSNGYRRLAGRDSNGQSFDLMVKGKTVFGTYGGQRISYPVPVSNTKSVRVASK